MKKPIYIDTDVGNDDLIAILMLQLSKKFNIKAFSTVYGVSETNLGTSNLARILTFINNPIPIIKGKTRAMNRNWQAVFPKIDRVRANKLTLLEKIPLPQDPSPKILVYNSLDKLADLIKSERQKITLVCLGPLTNIATLIEKCRDTLIVKVDQIILMGGAFKSMPGPPLSQDILDYNLYLDPEAADIIFNSSIPTTIIPINATLYVPAMVPLVKNQLKKTLEQFNQNLKQKRLTKKNSLVIRELILKNNYDFNCYYGPLVSAAMIDPNIVTKTYRGRIQVNLAGKNRGQTKLIPSKTKAVKIISGVKEEKFYRLLLNLLT